MYVCIEVCTYKLGVVEYRSLVQSSDGLGEDASP